ncbi:MAG: DmsE family decaheme c-type cytochrome [Armatimonadota bacterium]|nr:DmsE family decaheme c-type cytochrome [Armatimonadota bacterium]
MTRLRTCQPRVNWRGLLMKNRSVYTVLLSAAIAALWVCYSPKPSTAEEQPQYVGSEACATCHADVAKKWALTIHRKTLFNTEASRKGCEACHGPGSAHVAAGGGRGVGIVNLSKLNSEKSSAVCLKCHTQEKTMLWATGRHARAKLTCMNCHNPHSLDARTLLTDMQSATIAVEGLNKTIKEAQLRSGIADEGISEKTEALAQVAKLQEKRAKLEADAKGAETEYHKAAEPFMCYNCHKAQQAQSRMPSHHPLVEGKMKCSDCHNPHGGPNNMLREESVQDTCARCHAEKVGPFTFEHPPVNEDCSICHKPHGSVQNKLLTQSQPFLCLKCHAGPHSSSGALGAPTTFSRYYTECTDCHGSIHGSDRHQALHY